jgi:TPP-dependent pyruvate/acetoin dehydrogenase alpha subunit
LDETRPYLRFEDALLQEGLFTTEQFVSLSEDLEAEIKETIDWAKNQDDPDPKNEELDMFAERTDAKNRK